MDISDSDSIDTKYDMSMVNQGRSWEYFTSTLNEYYKRHNRFAGYSDSSYSPIVPIDIDNKTLSLDDIRQNISIVEPIIDIQTIYVYFSGKKGFHLEIPSSYFGIEPTKELSKRCKILVNNMGFIYDSSLYSNNHIYRLNNTKHEETGLYKRRICPYDILYNKISIDDIKDLAITPGAESFELNPIPSYKAIEGLVDEWKKTDIRKNTKFTNPSNTKEGNRNNTIFDTSLRLKTEEIPKEDALNKITKLNKNFDSPLSYDEMVKAFNSAYNSELFKPYILNPIKEHFLYNEHVKNFTDKELRTYLWLVTNTNYRGKFFAKNGMRTYIYKNQIIVGKSTYKKIPYMKESTFYKHINKFEFLGLIHKEIIKDEQGFSKGTRITLLKVDVTLDSILF